MKIAIQGHLSRGHEVIQILESLGGKSRGDLTGRRYSQYYFINSNGDIDLHYRSNLCTYKLYTLEEFEREFPFKVGDLCVYQSEYSRDIVVKVLGMIIQGNDIVYEIGPRDVDNTYSGIYRKRDTLKPYKEMKEERNIKLTLTKAKEWYSKGGELKEIALQAFTEKELTKVDLPKTWEELCKSYPMKEGESYVGACSEIHTMFVAEDSRDIEMDRNVCPSKQSAEAHLALIQLEQLRDCWRQGWVPDYTKTYKKYRIKKLGTEYIVDWSTGLSDFLVFQTEELAKEFLECFRDLIEKAGDLI